HRVNRLAGMLRAREPRGAMLMLQVAIDQHSASAEAVAASAPVAAAPLLCVVVPTFDEKDNVEELVQRIGRSLKGTHWEILFVDDDSPDGTADAVRALAGRDPRVRCLHRIGRRGLSSACVEGILASSAP